MKIGMSFSNCIAGIIDGEVNFDEVLVIISSTNIDPTNDEQWAPVWDGYVHGMSGSRAVWRHLHDREAEVRELAVRLYKAGRIHQPRQFGARPPEGGTVWMEVVHCPMGVDSNSTVQQAWDHYQTVAGLCNTGKIYPADRLKASQEVKPMTPEEEEKYRQSLAMFARCLV